MITSRQNSWVREIRTLIRDREPGRFVLEGPILLQEALDACVDLETLVVSPRGRDDAALLERARRTAPHHLEVSEEILEYVADSQHPQGILAVAREPRLPWTCAEGPSEGTIVVLDELRDPGNLGTILRTVRATGGAGVVLAGASVDPWSPKVVRASAGAIFRVPLARWGREQVCAWLRRGRSIAVHAHGRQDLYATTLVEPLALVFGNESHGLGADLEGACADSLRIPMAEACESLNLAVATAVTLYHLRFGSGSPQIL